MDDAFTSRLEITYGPAGSADRRDPVGSSDPLGSAGAGGQLGSSDPLGSAGAGSGQVVSAGLAGGIGAEPGQPISLDLHPILRDFAHSTASASHRAWLTGLTWTAHLRDAMIVVTASSPDGSSFGFGIPDGPAASRLAAAADRLQDFVVEHLRVGLPPVPGTARPARAHLHDDVALWADDRTAWTCPIGSYA
ncbi:hypothetical protein AB0878_13715 [Amycolatopsis sp. NPDC047767]|uniref:hypothetical protein n=1 Tax=Amycolatopsis sp. NPDC047767 TaxID=3156765 RepID=UPI003456B5BD